ncbi:LysR family transcriptional regulator [Alteromonas sp. P256]|uniref:LysR family transcriptional regulator n=1 Tax=Alteromonas sp. P256 TaxID=3117399 RepID=UPI002FE388EB
MKIGIDDMRMFLRIVELGSLRMTAIELNTEPSRVTRRLNALEEHVGIKLIERSKVQSAPTEAGQLYYDNMSRIIEELEQIEVEVAGAKDTPKGLLRVSCPVDFGAQYVSLWASELQQRHAKLEIEILLSDQYVDLMHDNVDVAIRIGQLQDSTLKSRHLGDMRMCVVGHPDYVNANIPNGSREELANCEFIRYQWLATPDMFTMKKNNQALQIPLRGRLSVNNVGAIANLVHTGAGLHYGPIWLFGEDIQNGKLVELFADWEKPVYPVHALYKYTRTGYLPAKVRTFIDTLVSKMESVQL